MILLVYIFVFRGVLIGADIVPVWSTSLLDSITNDTVPLRYTGPTPRLLTNCEGSAQMYLSEYAYLSQNGFVTPMAPMRIPSNLLQVDDPVVETAIVRSESIALLISGSVIIYTLQTAEYQRAIVPVGYRVTALEFAQYCCKHFWCEDFSDAVVAVGKLDDSGEDDLHKIFVLEKGEIEFHGTPLPDDVMELELSAAVPILPWHSVALLYLYGHENNQPREAMFHYLHIPFKGRHPEQSENHTESAMRAIVYSHRGGNLKVVHFTNRFGEFLMWGPRELYVSKTAGQSVFRATEELTAHLHHDEYIQELMPGANGDFAFLTSDGRLFYGRSNLATHIAELHVDDLVDVHSAIMFDKESHIYIMNARHYDLDSRNASTHALVYLASELIYPSEILEEQAGHELPECPFLLFTADFGSEMFYIDIGHTLILRASFVPSLWQDSNVMGYSSNPSIITVNTGLTSGAPIGHGLNKIEVNANISLTGDQPGMEDGEYIDGLTTVTFSSAVPSLTCLPNPSVQAYVSAGCPPEKTIRARQQVKRESCEYLKNYIYTFERDEYDPSFMEGTNGIDEDQGMLSIQYDYGKHACPDRSYHSDGYKPQFDLYMGDEFIEQMDADYAMVEIHGVYNYDYLMTAQQAGCTRRPQSWVEMLTLQNTTKDPTTAWTRYNYQDCLEAKGSQISDTLPYQVLNAKTKNKILWRQKKAIYVFNVTVLDPKYSYCNLQTQFAVEVYGALPQSPISAITVMLITCGLGFAAVIIIFIYNLVKLKEEEEEDQPIKKIPQFPH